MGKISTEAPRTMAAAIIPKRGRRLDTSFFSVIRRRMVQTRTDTIHPETQSQVGKTPSGRWICDIRFFPFFYRFYRPRKDSVGGSSENLHSSFCGEQIQRL